MLTELNREENKTSTNTGRKGKFIPAKEIKKILVPVDFSASAEKAFHFARKISEPFNANIYLVHIVNVPAADEHMPPSMVAELIETAEVNGDKQLEAFLKKVAKNEENIYKKTLVGFVADSIVQYARTESIDLIIIGTQGINSVGDKLFGTVSWNTIKHAHIPVLTVPFNAQVDGIKNILIPFEGTDKDIEIIGFLLHFASYFGATVYGIHFIVNNYVMNKTLADKIQAQFRKEIESGKLVFHFLSEKNITDGILKFVQKNNIDLVSMITYHRGLVATIFHMSICRYVSTHFTFPLLAFNADK